MLQANVDINDVYFDLLDNTDRYLVLVGGSGSGKSVFAAQKLVTRCLQGKERFLAVRKVSDTLKDSVFKLMTTLLSDMEVLSRCDVNKTDKTILFPNGSEIIMKGSDDPEKIKSIAGITGIWIEEATEITSDDFDQLDLRLRGKTASYKQIILTFNPIDERHWLKKRFFSGEMESCTTLKTTYQDNFFIDEEYKRVLDLKAKVNPNYYRIYKLGEWGKPDVQRPYVYNFNYDRHVGKVEKIAGIPIRTSLDFNLEPFVATHWQMYLKNGEFYCHCFDETVIKLGGILDMCQQLEAKFTKSEMANMLFTGDATARKRNMQTANNIGAWGEIDTYFRLGKRLQVPTSNPIVRENRHLVNAIFALLPNLLISDSCKLLISEIQFTEATPEGDIIKASRKDLSQRADALDTNLYLFNTWMSDFSTNPNKYRIKY